MPEYFKYRCCMCPNINKPSLVCPGIPGTLHPEASPCRFAKSYIDSRGWRYSVRNPIVNGRIIKGQFKGFYLKPNDHYWQPMLQLPLMSDYDGAQRMLNCYAEKKGWKEHN